MREQYFCAIFSSPEKQDIVSVEIVNSEDQSLDMELNLAAKIVPPNSRIAYEISFYFGPQEYQRLKDLGFNLHKIVNFGWFHIIGVAMLYILKVFFKITGNYGVAIILLTILIRGILWWPTQKSYTSMKKMQGAMSKMQPRIKTLKELYKNNPAKLNEETMKLYKEYQINPMGGCLPMLLQMPVFFALYKTLTTAVELRGAEFVWMWKDLSSKDPAYILPIAMGASMFIQQKMSTPPAATPESATQQKMMLYLMPIMLTFFSFMWPSGLLLYWVVSNILSIGQQVLINKKV
jgi:YidC/Oxa1 family membrane protein insertase